jgi:hypothetical protein
MPDGGFGWNYYEFYPVGKPGTMLCRALFTERLSDEDYKHLSTTLKIDPCTRDAIAAIDLLREESGYRKIRWRDWSLRGLR